MPSASELATASRRPADAPAGVDVEKGFSQCVSLASMVRQRVLKARPVMRRLHLGDDAADRMLSMLDAAQSLCMTAGGTPFAADMPRPDRLRVLNTVRRMLKDAESSTRPLRGVAA